MRRALEGVDGVGRVQIAGGREREIHVLLDPTGMKALNVSVQEVMRALQQQNLEIPAGRVEHGNRGASSSAWSGRIERRRQFGEIVVADRNGRFVRLSQVARRCATPPRRSGASRSSTAGRRWASTSSRWPAPNTVNVADGVQQVVERFAGTLPART